MLQIPVGAKICKIFNQIYLYPEQKEQIKQKIAEMNQIIMGRVLLKAILKVGLIFIHLIVQVLFMRKSMNILIGE